MLMKTRSPRGTRLDATYHVGDDTAKQDVLLMLMRAFLEECERDTFPLRGNL